MACYSPLVAVYRTENYDEVFSSDGELLDFKVRRKLNPKTGNPMIRILGRFSDDKDAYELLKKGQTFTLPCGKCIGCKLDYARHWADRMMLEYLAFPKAVFVTLTYADVSADGEHHIPMAIDCNTGESFPELRKKDLSEFMKCLRQKFVDNGRDDVLLRFFGCGEYGERNHRPHYHLILFGVDLYDLQNIVFSGDIHSSLEPWTCNELGQLSYRSNFLEDAWKERGFCTVSDVSYDTMAYVGRYSLKKARGSEYTQNKDISPEFTLMSRNPGIGKPFLEKMKYEDPEYIDKVSCLSIGPNKSIFWPKYLIDKYYSPEYYGVGCEAKLEALKSQRQKISINNFLNVYENDDRPYYQKQDFLEKQKTYQVRTLKREMESMVD